MANPFTEELQRRQSGGTPAEAPASNPFTAELERRQSVVPDPADAPPPTDAERTSQLRSGRLGITGGIPGAKESMESADPFVQAERLGVESEGAPQDLRKAYLQMSPGMRDQYSEYMVNSYFNKKSGGNSDFVPVQYNEAIGTHLFKDPDDGKWKPLNDLGIDLEDTREVMKYIVAPVGGSLLAGMGTAAVTGGSPFMGGLAATGTDAAISGAMRTMDINSLLEQELLPEEYVSAGFEGAKESGWALLGSAIGGAGGRVVRRGLGGVDDLPTGVDVDRKTINNMLERFDQEYGDTMPNLTLDEKASLVAKTPKEKAAALRLRARKENLQISSEANKKLIERQMENREAYTKGLDQFLQVVGKKDEPGVFRNSGLSADELLNSSTRIIDTLNRESKAKLQQYDAVLADAYTKAQQTADDVLSDATDPLRMPESFASVFTVARENFQNNMGKQYDAIGEATGGQRVFDIAPVRAKVADLRQRFQDDAAFLDMILGAETRGLSPQQQIRIGGGAADNVTPDEDAAMAALFGGSFGADRSGLLVPKEVIREKAANTTFGYKEVDSALLKLRERMREASGKVSDKTMAQMRDLQYTLEEVRDKGLRSIDPELADSQRALDATYRIGMDALDRGIGKKLADQYLAPRPGMDGLLKPSTFDKLFKGDAGAETVRDLRTLMDMDVINADPSNPIDMLGVVDNVRRGLLGKLQRRTVTEAGEGGEARVLTPESFQQFKDEYNDALSLALRPETLAKIEDMTGLRKALQKAEADNKAVREKIAEMPWGNKDIANDPAQLIRKTWGPADDPTILKRSRQLRQALREQGDPDGLMSDYRKLIAHDMMSNITDKQTGMVDPYRMKQYLNDHQELLAEWYTTRRDGKSGLDLVNNLNAYARIGQTIRESAGLSHADKDAMLQAVNSVARAYVGVFTTAGRVLTAVKQLGGGASLSKETDFILNPGKYIKNQEFYEILNSPQMRALNRAGGHTMVNMLRDRGEERPTDEPLPGESTPLFERRM